MSSAKTRRNILIGGFGGYGLFSVFMLLISGLPLHLTALSLLILFPFIAVTTLSGARRAVNAGDGTWRPTPKTGAKKDSPEQLR